MHVTAKKMAFAGLMLAFTIVCIALGSIIETNTLFLLAAASFFVGIVLRETSVKTGTAFYIAAILLGVFVSPNKLYVVSYGAMGLYILLNEVIFRLLGRLRETINRQALFWILKYLVFNIMYIPMLLAFQKLLFGKELSVHMLLMILAAGQAALFVYDRAYEYAQGNIWNKLRGRLFRV